MTVGELIEQLSKWPSDTKIYVPVMADSEYVMDYYEPASELYPLLSDENSIAIT